ncbi:hypothetical protein BGX38DRAFT_1143115 [Terfezia claveryi]|nr:hypothetical protein BGX38DRAFT_1143115 [Terfezia claveryi]
MAIYYDDLSSEAGMKKTVLGEKTNIFTSATKPSVKMLGNNEKKVRHIKLVDSKKATSIKKRPLSSAAPSTQRVARKPTTLSRFTSKPGEAGRHRALERARALYSSSPLRTAISSSDESDCGVLLTVATAAPMAEVPESWVFNIYEDSHAETMQNLMEHSATVLDISDESEDEKWGIDEVFQKGKENISPERMAELMAGAGRDSMQVDTKEKISKGNRAALGELEVLKFYPKEEEEEVKKEATAAALDFGNIPSLDAPTSGLGYGAGFEVWASEGETDEESDRESGVPLTPPKGLEQKVRIVLEDEIDECVSECGASDKEN